MARRLDVTFPTAVLDLRPVAAGYDNALAWLARYRGLKGMSSPIARWSRRLVIHVHDIHSQTFAAGTPQQYELVCLWVSNAADEDADGVRFQTRWTDDSPRLNVKTEAGVWLAAGASDSGHAQDGASAEVKLESRGHMRYVGLAVKYFDDDHAYMVTPETYHRFKYEGSSWRWPSHAVGPGLHFVDLAFRSQPKGKAIIRLTLMNPGRGANLSVQLSAGQLVT